VTEAWALRKQDLNAMKAAEVKFISSVKGIASTDKMRNEHIRNE
jgi:hypothetical protein